MASVHFDCDGCEGVELVERGVVVVVGCTKACTCTECVEYRASVEAERDAKMAQRAADDVQGDGEDFGGADWRSR